jgi:hypothetical protein
VIIRVILLAFLFSCFPITLLAAETTIPFEVEPIYSNGQIPSTKGYFDVMVNPGEKLTLRTRIKNNLNKGITVKMKATNAYSNPTGGILYGAEMNSNRTVLLGDAVRMADYIETKESYTIPASSSIEVPIQVTVPINDGQTLLGGILFTLVGESKDEFQETLKDQAKFRINTETTYAIAVKLNLPNKSVPQFSLENADFIPERAQVFIEMKNDAQMIQEDIVGDYAVMDSSRKELFTGHFNSFKMAPKSKIQYPFNWNDEIIKEGTYILFVSGTAGDIEYSSEKTFSIQMKDVQAYAEQSQPRVEVQKGNQGIPIWLWIIGIFLFGFIMYVMGRRKK